MNAKSVLMLSLMCLSLAGQPVQADDPKYTGDGQLILPANYREWIYLSSGLGMTYGVLGAVAGRFTGQSFDNVFVSPLAYKRFLETGRWPDKTIFVKEVRAATTKGSLNQGGHYQEGIVTIEAHVKDQGRFPGRGEFFVFGTGQTAKPLGAKSNCQACHMQRAAVDGVFVQFYPTLTPIAKAKGTLKEPQAK